MPVVIPIVEPTVAFMVVLLEFEAADAIIGELITPVIRRVEAASCSLPGDVFFMWWWILVLVCNSIVRLSTEIRSCQ